MKDKSFKRVLWLSPSERWRFRSAKPAPIPQERKLSPSESYGHKHEKTNFGLYSGQHTPFRTAFFLQRKRQSDRPAGNRSVRHRRRGGSGQGSLGLCERFGTKRLFCGLSFRKNRDKGISRGNREQKRCFSGGNLYSGAGRQRSNDPEGKGSAVR